MGHSYTNPVFFTAEAVRVPFGAPTIRLESEGGGGGEGEREREREGGGGGGMRGVEGMKGVVSRNQNN